MQSVIRGELEVSAFRAYAGYSGWAPGQLENEIVAGSWNIAEADADLIFAADTSTIWPELNRRLNGLTAQLAGSPAGSK
jgi:putative transcriptional regulator